MEETLEKVESERSAAARAGEPHMSRIFPKEGLVERYLEARVLQNDDLVMIRNCRTLLRKDHDQLADQVKILSGGPARMEPLFSGCVGAGMLTGAVLGEPACAPPHPSVLAALRALARGDRAGVLVVVPDDPANRLNFGLACQEAAHEGVKTVCLAVGEDCSGTGRRGSCGVAFLLKIAGAMAEERRSIYEMACVLTGLKGRALGSVSVLVGEAKSAKHRHSLADVVAEAMFCLFHPLSERSLFVDKRDRVAVLLNNLGKMSDLHQALIARELLAHLNVAGVTVARLYAGRLSGQDQDGFSVSVLRLNDRALGWLDGPTAAAAWPAAARLDPFKDRCLFFVGDPRDGRPDRVIGPRFAPGEARLAVDTLVEAVQALVEMRDYLDAIDAAGEFGTTGATKLARAIGDKLAARSLHVLSPHGLLDEMGEAASHTGGVAGPLFGAVFCAAAQAFVAGSSVRWRHWMEAAASARDAVVAYALDAAVLDALAPFADTFDAPTPRRLSAAVRAAVAGAEARMDPAAYALAVALRIAFEKYRQYRLDVDTCDR